jgi:hypothetical protein
MWKEPAVGLPNTSAPGHPPDRSVQARYVTANGERSNHIARSFLPNPCEEPEPRCLILRRNKPKSS